jgi:hypothetical protein
MKLKLVHLLLAGSTDSSCLLLLSNLFQLLQGAGDRRIVWAVLGGGHVGGAAAATAAVCDV